MLQLGQQSAIVLPMARSLNLPTSSLAAMIRIIADKAPQTTLREVLADPWLGGQVQSMTIGELLGIGGAPTGASVSPARAAASGGERPAKTSKAPKAAKKASAPRAAKSAEVTTAEGRAAYTSAVLDVIASASRPWSAQEVRAKAGGTDLQFRAAVERLLAAKKVKRTGKARGTRYTVA